MQENITSQLQLFSQEDSRANPTLVRINTSNRSMIVSSGRKCSELFKNSTPLSSSLRMFLASERTLTLCRLIWKPWGTKHIRLGFRLVHLVRHSSVNGFTWLPRPQASEGFRLKYTIIQLNRATERNAIQGRSGECGLSLSHQLAKRFGIYCHPNLVERLMGFPTGWTDLQHLETPSSRRSRRKSGG